jgi:predicted transcriptional regulator
MWAGPDVRQDALDECNAAVVAGGFAADCEVVIEDAAEEASQGPGIVAAE